MRSVSRRITWLATTMAAALVITACGGSGTTGTGATAVSATSTPTPQLRAKVVVSYGSVNGDNLPMWVAKEAGIFDRNGLDVELQLVSSSAVVMAALLSNQVQVAQLGGSEAVQASAGGADVVVLAVTSPVYSFVFEVSSAIKTASDLRGKAVAVSSIGSSSDIAMRVALRKLGLEPDRDVAIVATGDVPTRIAAMRSGAVSGTLVAPPDNLIAEAQGAHVLLNLAAEKLPAALQSIIMQRSYVKTNQDVVQRYVDSIMQAIARIKADKAFSVGVLKKYLKYDDDKVLGVTYDFLAGEVIASQPFPRSELFADSIVELGKKNEKVRGFDVAKIIERGFVQNAVDRGIGK